MFKVYDKNTGEKLSGCFAIWQGQLMQYSKTLRAFIPINNADYIIKKTGLKKRGQSL